MSLDETQGRLCEERGRAGAVLPENKEPPALAAAGRGEEGILLWSFWREQSPTGSLV